MNLFYNDDENATRTSMVQKSVENALNQNFYIHEKSARAGYSLNRDDHIKMLLNSLVKLSSGYQSLDSSRPWLCYWILNSLDLLDAIDKDQSLVIDFLKRCVHPEHGGYGGGPGQIAHLAPSYATVNAITVIGTKQAYESIDRKSMLRFLEKVKDASGGFRMHDLGEVDVRSTYCALSIASTLNILNTELVSGTAQYIFECQTYEGGFGGEPGNEAHGGYAFCGLAGAIILITFYRGLEQTEYVKTQLDILLCRIDYKRLLHWLVHRQMKFEGGFQGRTNKLVDSCYSFWQGAITPLLGKYFHIGIFPLQSKEENNTHDSQIKELKPDDTLPQEETWEDGHWIFRQRALQDYILLCAQDPKGGMRDKPPKKPDLYHTCYALCGLSIAQNHDAENLSFCVVGKPMNLLNSIDPLYGVRSEKSVRARNYYYSQPPV